MLGDWKTGLGVLCFHVLCRELKVILDRLELAVAQVHRDSREIGERPAPRVLRGPLGLPDQLDQQEHLVLVVRMELMANQVLLGQMECEEKV